MRLIEQPGAGIEPLLKSIRKARKSVKILIFRLDVSEVERALVDAGKRGVFVHALIAFTNRGGEKSLRDLEARFLANGITVARTSGDLVRYHGKMMIVDNRELHILAYNFTHLDIEHSRSFSVVTRNRKLVEQADALFEADCKRQQYAGRNRNFVVSPVNARQTLAAFLKGAKKSLLIYDPKVGDPEMLKILEARAKAGVEIRVIGKASHCSLPARELTFRLHARTIIRDGREVFVGSQSLRKLELDSRREIGIIFRDSKVARKISDRFKGDWKESDKLPGRKPLIVPKKAAQKVAKAAARRLSLKPVVAKVAKAVRKSNGKVKIDERELQRTVSTRLKKIVKQTVAEAAEDVVKELAGEVA